MNNTINAIVVEGFHQKMSQSHLRQGSSQQHLHSRGVQDKQSTVCSNICRGKRRASVVCRTWKTNFRSWSLKDRTPFDRKRLALFSSRNSPMKALKRSTSRLPSRVTPMDPTCQPSPPHPIEARHATPNRATRAIG